MKYINILIVIMSSLILFSCDDVLDVKNLAAISEEDVWNDYNLASAYVDQIYNKVMPGWGLGQGSKTDEAWSQNLSDIQKGTATIEDVESVWNYDDLFRMNLFFEKINTGSIENNAQKEALTGQVHFLRAFSYFLMVRTYGGVPLVLTVQDPFGEEDVFLQRAKTSECIAQIIDDLDSAINKLPDTWTGYDAGRIDKCAALAMKGKVLLNWASPQFNPSGDAERWQAAYNATKEAVEFCEANGKKLHSNFSKIFYDEMNEEVIMVRRYNNPEIVYSDTDIRPCEFGGANKDQATWDLANSFPLKDGSKFDTVKYSLSDYYLNRDDRFYATIGYNGCDMGLPDMKDAGTYLWVYYDDEGKSVEKNAPQGYYAHAGFYRKKGTDLNQNKSTSTSASVDWIEMRFAEVLMNYGEAANEVGQTDEALDVLYQIRNRAGILAGADSKYGITATTREEIRQAYLDERQVEFAFEGKRWWDLRRTRRFDVLNTLKRRSGLKMTLLAGEEKPSGFDDIDLAKNRFMYEIEEFDNEDFNLLDKYYFQGLPKGQMAKNPNMAQTQGWEEGGENVFDPLL